MPKLLLTVGASSSGKTTWVVDNIHRNLGWVDLNRDDFRFKCKARDWRDYKFTKANENRITETINGILDDSLEKRLNIVISDTNLNPKTRNRFKQLAEKHGYDYVEKAFECSWDELVSRSENRQGGVSLPVLRRQYLQMLDYLGRRKYVPNKNLPPAVIVDVDGTVADMTGVRGPFDWNKVDLDNPREIICNMVKGLTKSGISLIFFSGRDGVAYEKTFKWISENVYPVYELYMRAEGDRRKDFVIKEELFWPLTEKYNIVGAIDDRPQVLRLWEELGIPNVVNVNSRGLYGEF